MELETERHLTFDIKRIKEKRVDTEIVNDKEILKQHL